jgi:hypothetical protein
MAEFHELLGVLKMLIFFGAVLAFFLVPGYLRTRDRERARNALHETLRVAYEKGQAVPPELIEALQTQTDRKVYVPSAERDLRNAIILLAVGGGFAAMGAAIYVGLLSIVPDEAAISGASTAAVGAIPGFIGLAYLVLWLAKRGSAKV